jgi:hypothetical protein
VALQALEAILKVGSGGVCQLQLGVMMHGLLLL